MGNNIGSVLLYVSNTFYFDYSTCMSCFFCFLVFSKLSRSQCVYIFMFVHFIVHLYCVFFHFPFVVALFSAMLHC